MGPPTAEGGVVNWMDGAPRRAVVTGTVLAEAGQPAEAVLVVIDGALHLTSRNPDTVRQHVVERVGRWGLVGDVEAVTGRPHGFRVVAGAPSVVAFVGVAGFLSALNTATGRQRWSLILAERDAGHRRRIEGLVTRDLRGRVASTLLDHADDSGTVSLSHRVIAEVVGARRQSVTRVLAQMGAEGLVGTGYRTVRILDPERLRSTT